MAIHRADLQGYVVEALRKLGGQGKVAEIAREIWNGHEKELRDSGDLFYTWQYDMRWAGQVLQHKKKLKKARSGGTWTLLN